MKMLDRVISAGKILINGETKNSNPFNSRAFGDFGADNGYKTDREQLTAYEKIEWMSIAVDIVSRDAGGQGYFFTDQAGSLIEASRVDSRIIEPIQKGYFTESFSQMIKRVIAHRLLTGNAYFLLGQSNMDALSKGYTDMFIPLFPQEVTPITDATEKLLMGYKVRYKNGAVKTYPVNQVVHFKQNANFNPFVGIGNVTKMRLVAESDTSAQEYLAEFIKNKATPSMIVTTKDTSASNEDYLRKLDMLRAKYEGRKNAGKAGYFEGEDVKVLFNSVMSQKDMQFIEGKAFTRQTILSMFGVPPVVAGIPEGANKAIALTMRLNYLSFTINNLLEDLESTLNSQFIKQIDQRVKIKFERYPTGDLEEITKGIQYGIYSPNRGAELVGESVDKDDEAGWQRYMPNSWAVLGDTMGFGFETTEEGKTIKTIPKDITQEDLSNPKNVEAIVGYFLKDLEEKGAFRQKQFQASYLRRGLKSRNTTEDKYYPTIEKYFKGQKKRIIRKFNEMFEVKADITDITDMNPELVAGALFDINLENGELTKDLRPLHTSSVQKSIADINIISGNNINTETSNPVVKRTIDSLGQRIKGFTNKEGVIVSINASTKKEIAKIITRDINKNLSVKEISENISKKYDVYTGYRARRIARTESRVAWDAGAYESYNELGVGTVDVIGCDFTSVTASYGTQDEIYGDCGKTGIPIAEMAALDFHPNHIGVIAPSKEI